MNYKNKEIVIWLGFLIALGIIVLYIFLDELGNCNIFIVLLNLSFSYIAAVLFYVAQVKIPNINNKKKAFEVLSPDIHSINEELNFLIAFIDAAFKIQDNELYIKGIDDNIIYIKHYRNDMVIREYVDYRNYLKNSMQNIKNNLVKLQNRFLYQYLPDSFINVISKLDMEKFSSFASIPNIFPICTSFQNLENDIEKFRDYQSKINKFDKNNVIHKVEILDQKEKNAYKKRLKIFKEYQQKEIDKLLKENRK